MKLSELAVDDYARIEAVGGSGELRQHFLDMGLIPGCDVSLIKFAPMGDPIEIRIHDYELTLRLADAEHITVEKIDPPVGDDEAKAKAARRALRREIEHPGLGESGIYHDKNDESILSDCIKESVSLIKILDEDNDKIYWLYYLVGSSYEKIGEYEKAREYLIQALPIDDVEKEREIQEMLDKVEDNLKIEWKQYTKNHSYMDRRLIMPIKDSCIAGCVCDEIKTFRISHLPSDFEFPATIPVANQLYIGHQYNPNVYVPFDHSEDYFFRDKVEELCKLLYCLGAKTITIKHITGKDISELYKGDFEAKVNAGYKLNELEVQINKEKSINQKSEKTGRFEQCLRYGKPIRPPYIPDDLHWFHHSKDRRKS